MILTRENIPLFAGVFVLSALAAVLLPGPDDRRWYIRAAYRLALLMVFDVALLSVFTAAGVLR